MQTTLKAQNGPDVCRQCKTKLPEGHYKTRCEPCLAKQRTRATEMRQKRKFEELENVSPDGRQMEKKPNIAKAAEIEFASLDKLITEIKLAFQVPSGKVNFRGRAGIMLDPCIGTRERIQLTASEIWRVSGYRFRNHDYAPVANGVTGRFWCCQDATHKKKPQPSTTEGVQHCETLGMQRFNCRSEFLITCTSNEVIQNLRVILSHSQNHTPYFDVSIPPEAIDIIRNNIDWALPNDIIGKVQLQYKHVTAKQITTVWTKFAQGSWKRNPKDQMDSARQLLQEFSEEVDVLKVDEEKGVDQLTWGMRAIAEKIGSRLVEVGLDATYNTNSRNLELYSIIGEYDNEGYPLSYCLLSTATSIESGKQIKALSSWIYQVKEVYGIHPTFVHVDKDMAEINAVKEVWNPKIQLCWWHLKKAVRERLKKTKLSTTPYNAMEAHTEFSFIDPRFTPNGRPDATETEGLPIFGTPNKDSNPADEFDAGPRQFCPERHRDGILELIEKHFCAHPLIPDYCPPNLNWYRTDRWPLWARSTFHEIPRLKTTMMVEAHWCKIKQHYLEHFHKPRLDLLVYTLIRKLAPAYYRKLELTSAVTGRLRELSAWRKAFKRQWKLDAGKDQNYDLYDRYRPDPHRWVCTCPHFVVSHFLICKHLVQSVKPVPPHFFFEVTRNRTAPFWKHKHLVPADLDGDNTEEGEITDDNAISEDDLGGSPLPAPLTVGLLDDPDRLITTKDELVQIQGELEEFVNKMMKYQINFGDLRWLQTLKREGASFHWLAKVCKDREHTYNMTHGPTPTTWDPKAANAMYYRTRPPAREMDT